MRMKKKKLINTFWQNVERYQRLGEIADDEIARYLGIRLVGWQNYRRTKSNASLTRIEKIAEALRVQPLDLMEEWTDAEWNRVFGKYKK